MSNFKKHRKLTKTIEGVEQRQFLLDNISNNQGFFPKPVLEQDMDDAFIEYIDKGMNIIFNGQKIPVIFLTIQRWTEFTRTWKFTDKYKDIQMPFIVLIRKPATQEGTSHIGLWNIAGQRHYTYYKVPTNYGGGRKGIDLYKIPQPTAVDLIYEFRIFTNKFKTLNEVDRIIRKAFKSRQHYIYPNGHPMPLTLESTGDESNIDDFENRRFYTIMHEIKLAGYILDSDDFIIEPAVDRACLVVEVEENIIKPKFKISINKPAQTFNYGIIFKPRSEQDFSFVSDFDLKMVTIQNIENISNIIIKVNGVTQFNGLLLSSPIIVAAGDTIHISVTKDFYNTSKFQLLGTLIV